MACQTITSSFESQGTGRRAGPAILSAAALRKLSPQDRVDLHRLATEPTPFINHPDLHGPQADVEFFGVEAKLPAARATWFPAPTPIAADKVLPGSRLATLSTEDEQRLFKRLNYVRMKILELLARHRDKCLTLKAARTLLAWGQWELDVREQIVEQNVPLVLAMAKRTRLAGVDFNEMISEGNMALLRSVNKFDCGRGFKFSTYACRAILKSFSRVAIRASRYRGTFPVEYDPSIERSDHLEKKRQDVETNCIDDLKDILAQNMADLTTVEQTVIKQRFALERVGSEIPVPKTLEQVGRIIGVTKERVRQIQNKALKKIRDALEESYLAA